MKSLRCDVCNRDITAEIDNRGYDHLAHRELCEPCAEMLALSIRPVMRTKQPFNYEWYDRLVRDSIEKAIDKGKW